MAVNTMGFEQSAILLNGLHNQVTGQNNIAPTNTNEFISVAQKTLQAGYDPLLNAITQVISKTIFSIRPYNRKFAGIQVDNQKWGSITRKLAISDKPFDEDERFTLTDGQSVDMFKVNKPNILQLNFYGANIWNKGYTIFKDQLDNAFRGPDEFGRFMSMITSNISDMIEQCHESTARATIANFVGGKIASNNGVVHLLTEYNTETGSSLTPANVYSQGNFGAFIRWMIARIATLSDIMEERSQLFQIQVTGHELNRHTPKRMQKVYILSKFMNEIDARVRSDAFHDDFLRIADSEAVNYWQAIKQPDEINVKATYLQPDGSLTESAQSVSTSGIIGTIFDEEALGYTVFHDWSATSPFNIKGGYWNVNHVFTERYWNDFTEKGIILLLD